MYFLERKTVKETGINGTPPPTQARAQGMKEKPLKSEKEKTRNTYNTSKNGSGKPKTYASTKT